MLFLTIKIVVSDRHNGSPRPNYPKAGGNSGIEEKQHIVRQAVALKTYLCREDAVGVGSAVDGAVCRGSELHSVLAVKNYAVNGIGV